MPTNPNDQDPRSTGGGDHTGVYGVGFGGRHQDALRKTEESVRTDDMIDRDVDAISASDQARDSEPARERLDTDDGKAGRLDELE